MATLADVLARHPGAQSFSFGDSQEMALELAELVISGAKRATCGRLSDYPEGAADRPVPGRRDVVTDHHGAPLAVIETVEVTECRFDEIGMDFALAEGENDDLEGWRRDHRRYFERNGGWSPDMLLLCERFRLVAVL